MISVKICSIKILFLYPTIEFLFFTAVCKNCLVKQPGLTISFWKSLFLHLFALAQNLVFWVWVLIQPQLHLKSLRSGDMRITCTECATRMLSPHAHWRPFMQGPSHTLAENSWFLCWLLSSFVIKNSDRSILRGAFVLIHTSTTAE